MQISLLQTVDWEAVESLNDRDDATYLAPVILSCRKRRKLKDLIDARGEVTTTAFEVLLGPTTTVAINDLLDGRQVIAIEDQIDITGQQVGYIALTR